MPHLLMLSVKLLHVIPLSIVMVSYKHTSLLKQGVYYHGKKFVALAPVSFSPAIFIDIWHFVSLYGQSHS
jgi:hypothetical protein